MVEIVLRGRKYPALFDLQNVKELQERYSDLTQVAEKLNDPEEAAFIIWLLIREGVELDIILFWGVMRIAIEFM